MKKVFDTRDQSDSFSKRHQPIPRSTHGQHPPLVSTPPETGGGGKGERPTFDCPHQPGCGFPGGIALPGCPALPDQIEDDGFITVHPQIGGSRHEQL